MLLQRSGLDLQEKSPIIANLKNNFSVQRVKESLRLTWSDEDIRHRDGQKGSSMYAELEEDESIYMAGESSIDGELAQLAEEDQVAYQAAEGEAQAAYAAIQGAKKTLREAREKVAHQEESEILWWFGGSICEASFGISSCEVLQVRRQSLSKGLPQQTVPKHHRTSPSGIHE